MTGPKGMPGTGRGSLQKRLPGGWAGVGLLPCVRSEDTPLAFWPFNPGEAQGPRPAGGGTRHSESLTEAKTIKLYPERARDDPEPSCHSRTCSVAARQLHPC